MNPPEILVLIVSFIVVGDIAHGWLFQPQSGISQHKKKIFWDTLIKGMSVD